MFNYNVNKMFPVHMRHRRFCRNRTSSSTTFVICNRIFEEKKDQELIYMSSRLYRNGKYGNGCIASVRASCNHFRI